MNLKKALERGRLKEFAAEHETKPKDRHPMGKERFDALMDAMSNGLHGQRTPHRERPPKAKRQGVNS